MPLASVLFRDGVRGDFPRQDISVTNIAAAQLPQLVNSSKYRKQSQFQVGDLVYVRNFQRSRKFDPLFLESPLIVVDLDDSGSKLKVKHHLTDQTFWRHPDDLKRFQGDLPTNEEALSESGPTDDPTNGSENDYDGVTYFDQPQVDQELLGPDVVEEPIPLRRSARKVLPNPRNYNEEIVDRVTWL